MYNTGCKENGNVERYGLKALHFLKQVKEFSAFEKDFIAVVKSNLVRNPRSDFRAILQEDIKLINNSKKTMTLWIKLLTCTNLQKRNTTNYYNYYGAQLLRNIKRQIPKSKIK